ncbi:hypothetical protein ES705_43266 [subsurface metagenome]
MAKKKELKQIVFSWHKSTGLEIGWNNSEVTYTADDDYVIVAIQGMVETFQTAVDTQVMGAQLSYDTKAFPSLTGPMGEAVRRRCLMFLCSGVFTLGTAAGAGNLFAHETIVFPEDCRPELDEDDQLNLHVFTSDIDEGGQVTFILHVYEK